MGDQINIVISPRPFAVVYNEKDFLYYVKVGDIDKKFGRYFLQRNQIKSNLCLEFTDGLQKTPVLHVENRLMLSGGRVDATHPFSRVEI